MAMATHESLNMLRSHILAGHAASFTLSSSINGNLEATADVHPDPGVVAEALRGHLLAFPQLIADIAQQMPVMDRETRSSTGIRKVTFWLQPNSQRASGQNSMYLESVSVDEDHKHIDDETEFKLLTSDGTNQTTFSQLSTTGTCAQQAQLASMRPTLRDFIMRQPGSSNMLNELFAELRLRSVLVATSFAVVLRSAATLFIVRAGGSRTTDRIEKQLSNLAARAARQANSFTNSHVFLRLVDRSFDESDYNGDGFVDMTEVYLLIMHLYKRIGRVASVQLPSKEQINFIVRQHDMDSNGKLDRHEFKNLAIVLCENVALRVATEMAAKFTLVPLVTSFVLRSFNLLKPHRRLPQARIWQRVPWRDLVVLCVSSWLVPALLKSADQRALSWSQRQLQARPILSDH